DEVARVTPIAPRVEIAQEQAVLQAEVDPRERARDLARDERLAADRRLVVEQDPVTREHTVGLAVVDGDPVGVQLRRRVRRAGIERRRLPLRRLAHQAVELGGRGLVEARLPLKPEYPDRLEDAKRAQ